MDLPALLPEELHYTAVAESDRNLFNLLLKVPQDFILFFEHACDDETWSEAHSSFMKESIQWLTNQFFQDKLLVEFAKRAASSIREHIEVLHPFVPENLLVTFNSSQKQVNSLLWGSSSDFLRNLIRQECRDKHSQSLQLNASPEVFEQVDEFITRGIIKELWRKEESEIIEVLEQATEWGLADLMFFCEEILKRYITRGNAISLLIKSHEKEWGYLRNVCQEFINELDVGVRLEKMPFPYLSLEFLNFNVDALEIFDNLRFHLTHLVFGGILTARDGFSDVINRCPAMICLDISRSESFTDRLLDIPATLEELDVAKCEWLNNKTLKKLVEICPNLTRIRLASNSQLKYSDWGILKDLKRLEKLDISRCPQITDEDFKIILQACRNVTHFTLEGCTGLTDAAFYEMGRHIPKLTDLDVSKCNISDAGLIDLAMRCQHLLTLNISRCPNLTDKGVVETVQNAARLKTLRLSKQHSGKDTIEAIRQIRPFLELITPE